MQVYLYNKISCSEERDILTILQLTGPTGAPGITGLTFAYLGCYSQTCTPLGCPSVGTIVGSFGFDDAGTLGGYNSTVVATASTNINSACAALCLTKSKANYFGTVNVAGTPGSGHCYCGVSITGLSSALANCVTCSGGNGVGQCGQAGSTIAVYARAF